MNQCNNLSLSINLIYGIHSSYYSIIIALSIENLFIIIWVNFWYYYSTFIPFIFFYLLPCFTLLFIFLLLLLWLFLVIWLVDFFLESYNSMTLIEQLILIIGIKLLLLSELMLFFACFWCYINFRLIGSIFVLFYFPLLSCYSFSIPFSVPLFVRLSFLLFRLIYFSRSSLRSSLLVYIL